MSHGVGGSRRGRRRDRRAVGNGNRKRSESSDSRIIASFAPRRSRTEPRERRKRKNAVGSRRRADLPIYRRREPREERAGTTASSHDRAAELAARGEVTRHAKETARRTCCWFAPGWRYSVRSCKIWSMPACCGCHMGGGGGAAMLSPRPRPRRVSVDRSSRDGDGQTVGSRLVKGGTVRRRAPLAVRPDVSIDRGSEASNENWSLGARHASAPSRERAKLGNDFPP